MAIYCGCRLRGSLGSSSKSLDAATGFRDVVRHIRRVSVLCVAPLTSLIISMGGRGVFALRTEHRRH